MRRPFGIRSTQTFGNACVQYGRIYGPGSNNTYDQTIATTLNQAVGSEDCLYLNIWRPATADGNLPVIVFIHGGSDVSGYTADPVYDGAALAKSANAVVVTANYRVGIFGWLNLPQLKDGSSAADDSGNFAHPRQHQGAAVRPGQHRQLRRQCRQRHARWGSRPARSTSTRS